MMKSVRKFIIYSYTKLNPGITKVLDKAFLIFVIKIYLEKKADHAQTSHQEP
jgi:hypothetical protein